MWILFGQRLEKIGLLFTPTSGRPAASKGVDTWREKWNKKRKRNERRKTVVEREMTKMKSTL